MLLNQHEKVTQGLFEHLLVHLISQFEVLQLTVYICCHSKFDVVVEPARVIADVNNGVVARRPVHERLGNRVGRIEEPYVEDISSDEEDKGPSVKKSKRNDDEE